MDYTELYKYSADPESDHSNEWPINRASKCRQETTKAMKVSVSSVACPRGSSGCSSTPLSSGTIARSVAPVTTIFTDNQKGIAKTNYKLTSIKNSLSKQQFLIVSWPKIAFFVSQLSSRACLLGAWLKILHMLCAIGLALPSLNFWTRHLS